MKEKIIEMFNKYNIVIVANESDEGINITRNGLVELADDILTLRYQIAREVQEEFRNQFNYTFTHFPNWTEYCEWLDQQEQE